MTQNGNNTRIALNCTRVLVPNETRSPNHISFRQDHSSSFYKYAGEKNTKIR